MWSSFRVSQSVVGVGQGHLSKSGHDYCGNGSSYHLSLITVNYFRGFKKGRWEMARGTDVTSCGGMYSVYRSGMCQALW